MLAYRNQSGLRVMGFFRLLIIIFLIWLAYYFVKRLLQANQARETRRKPDKLENMVRCAKCGLHVPEQEAVQAHERYYCSEAHRDEDDA